MPASLSKTRLTTSPQSTANGTECGHPQAAREILTAAGVSGAVLWCMQCGSVRHEESQGWRHPQPTPALTPAQLPAMTWDTQSHAAALPPQITTLIAANQGIFLDVGCSDHKSAGSLGMDKRAVDGVDIVHDMEMLPWPLPDACVKRMLASHIVEHLNPALSVDILNEMHRVMQPKGQLLIATPYAGSPRFWQDPTHRHG